MYCGPVNIEFTTCATIAARVGWDRRTHTSTVGCKRRPVQLNDDGTVRDARHVRESSSPIGEDFVNTQVDLDDVEAELLHRRDERLVVDVREL